MTKARNEDPAGFLRHIGESGLSAQDIALAALMLSALDHGGRPLQPYQAHLAELAEQARAEARLAPTAESAARNLVALIAGRLGYDGERIDYDDPQNADFISVIERRRGLPVALGILYLHAARAAGFEATGLNAPGHFLLKLAVRSDEVIIDPFNGGAVVEGETLGGPPGMRPASGSDMHAAEPMSDVDVLLRLENNLKMRAIQTGQAPRALEIVKRMILIAPRRAELWFELGQLCEATGALGAAQKAYESCLSLAPPGQNLHNEAALGLHVLKRRLN